MKDGIRTTKLSLLEARALLLRIRSDTTTTINPEPIPSLRTINGSERILIRLFISNDMDLHCHLESIYQDHLDMV